MAIEDHYFITYEQHKNITLDVHKSIAYICGGKTTTP